MFGLPKSGNTWLVSLLSDYTGLRPIDPYVQTDSAGVGMCHLPYSETIGGRCDFVHAVYLMRDIRDVIVSYFHHCQRGDWRAAFPHFHCDTLTEFYFEWFLPRVSIYHDVDNHAWEYISRGVPLVRYEALLASPAREFERLIRRLGFPLDRIRISDSVSRNSFEKLSRSGMKLEVTVPAEHFRKGRSGNYRGEMPRDLLIHVNRRFRQLLEVWGYPVDD